jgi:hypothetical protein
VYTHVTITRTGQSNHTNQQLKSESKGNIRTPISYKKELLKYRRIGLAYGA